MKDTPYLPGILLRLFTPLGIVHLGIVKIRRLAYRRGWVRSDALPRPVISLGNVQAGGSGKTPLTLLLLRELQQRGIRAGVLTRGYGRSSEALLLYCAGDEALELDPLQAGDEPVEIAAQLRRGGMAIGRDRYSAGLQLLQQCPVDCFLLDDGMQHLRLRRDLEICLLDVSRWPFHPLLIPFSSLRDAKSALRQADWVVLTKSADEPLLERVRRDVARFTPAGTLQAVYRLSRYSDLHGVDRALPPRAIALCGIANPQHFFDLLEAGGTELAERLIFPDHHRFALPELQAAAARQQSAGLPIVVTAKDAVKLRPLLAADPAVAERICVAHVEMQLERPEGLIEQVVRLARRV